MPKTTDSSFAKVNIKKPTKAAIKKIAVLEGIFEYELIEKVIKEKYGKKYPEFFEDQRQ